MNEIPFSVVWDTEGLSGMTTPVAGGTVTVTNACGSHVALAEVEEEYCGCHIWVPTAFTPDRDGVNEGFGIVSTCDWQILIQNLQPLGQQVWSTNDPDTPGTEAPTTWVAGPLLARRMVHYVLEWGRFKWDLDP